jgi:prophage antirepressor-like protein
MGFKEFFGVPEGVGQCLGGPIVSDCGACAYRGGHGCPWEDDGEGHVWQPNQCRDIYQENGFAGRREYLESLAEGHGCPIEDVLALAGRLGPEEDFGALPRMMAAWRPEREGWKASKVMTVFDYEGRRIRAATDEDDPWFVLDDVCRALGMRGRRVENAKRRLEPHEKIEAESTAVYRDGQMKTREMTMINTRGLYSVISFGLESETKNFERWAARVMLPAAWKASARVAILGEEEGQAGAPRERKAK